MQKKKGRAYHTPRLEEIYEVEDVVQTSLDAFVSDGYDPNEWQDENVRAS